MGRGISSRKGGALAALALMCGGAAAARAIPTTTTSNSDLPVEMVDSATADVLRAEIEATKEAIASAKLRLADQRRARIVEAAAAPSSAASFGASERTAHEMFLDNSAAFGFAGRRLNAEPAVVLDDETVIQDSFVATTFLNASKLTVAGTEIGNMLAEYKTRLDVLDQYLKVADVAHYYSFYFGIFLMDGGRAYDEVSPYLEMFDPYGIAVATINNKNYAFVCAGGDDTINILDASAVGLGGTIGSTIPLVRQYNFAYDSKASTFLDNPYAIDYHKIGTKHYIFVTTINTDGIFILDVSNPVLPLFVSYTDDTNVNFDKIANAYGIKAWTIGGKVWLAVSSYSYNTVADGGNGVQIMDVSIPEFPKFAASMVDGTDRFACLQNPWGIDIMEVNGVPFLFVASRTDDCLQVIDLTNPKDPVAAFAYTDMIEPFSYMDDPMYVKGFEVNNRFYVGVNTHIDHTIIFVDVTDPYNCKQASSAAFTSSMSSTGQLYYGIGNGANTDNQMDVYKTTDVFGRVNTFMVTVGQWSYGSFQLIDVSQPYTPIAVTWIQGQTSGAVSYYMMYYYTRGVRVVENKGIHYALVVCEYGAESTSYPNGVQVIKLDPKKTWDLTTTWASDSRIVYRNI